jgi:hypothetical protein
MQTIEEFMRGFFESREENELSYIQFRKSFRSRFFSEDCDWDSRAGTLAMNRSEELQSICETDKEATAITEFSIPFGKYAGKKIRLRYHLMPRNNSWLIHLVEGECVVCRGTPVENCQFCNGTGWLHTDSDN